MSRLPLRPRTFLVVYWALCLAPLVPFLVLSAGDSPHLLRLASLWFDACQIAHFGWLAAWIWSAARFAAGTDAGQLSDAPVCLRTLKLRSFIWLPILVALVALQQLTEQRDIETPLANAVAHILFTLGFFHLLWLAARVIADAEAAALPGTQPSTFLTVVSLFFAGFFAGTVYSRLEAMQASRPLVA
jgi:hypothetical protein